MTRKSDGFIYTNIKAQVQVEVIALQKACLTQRNYLTEACIYQLDYLISSSIHKRKEKPNP